MRIVYRKIFGLEKGRLGECPNTPNCVSSQSAKKRCKVDPIAMKGSIKDAKAKIKKSNTNGTRYQKIIKSIPRSKIADEKANYLRVECKTAKMGFIDDVEFLFSEDERVIHIRSAARWGYSDFNVNRKRVELIRRKMSGV